MCPSLNLIRISTKEREASERAEAESERPNFGTLRTSKSLGAAVSDYDGWQEENEEMEKEEEEDILKAELPMGTRHAWEQFENSSEGVEDE